jgi:sigma-B regulation protein RsbU (phosphoserine phosphatase)
VILHLPSGSLAYSSAGHTVGHLLDRSGVVKGRLAATGLPLGLFPASQYETRSQLGMDCGDTLVLLTDGVTDCGTPEEELFGTERALDAIRSSAGERSSYGVDALFRAVKAFEKGGRLRDDVTAVVVKRPVL